MNERFDLKKPQHLIALFLVLFVLLTIPLTVVSVLTRRDDRSQAANTTSIYLSPASQNVNVNSDLVVNVRENSGVTPVITAEISLNYDATKLDYVSTDAPDLSDFKDPIVNAPTTSTGVIYFVRIVRQPITDCPVPGVPCPNSVTGDKLIATVRFRAKTIAGPTAINIAATSNVWGLNEDETSTRIGGTYTVVDVPPTVSMTAPAAGSFVKGNAVTLSADATDNLGVTRVEFYDGAALVSTDTTATVNSYSVPWNTTLVAAGSHTLTAKAFDANGSTTSAPVTVTVDNTAPTAVTISGLAAKVKGSVIVTSTATDTNMDRLAFQVDNGTVTIDNTSPYNYNINTNLLANAADHTLSVVAYDKAGNQSLATAQAFAVDNLPPSAPVLSGTAISETQIDLSWTASTDTQSGPVTYDVYRNGTKITPTPQSATTYSATGLTASTTYSFLVKALDTMGNSVDSNTLTIATKNPPKEGDINLDGKVSSLDLAILIATWGSTTDLRADINKDGRVSSADLAKLISRWGS